MAHNFTSIVRHLDSAFAYKLCNDDEDNYRTKHQY